jgi:hypothetical protein
MPECPRPCVVYLTFVLFLLALVVCGGVSAEEAAEVSATSSAYGQWPESALDGSEATAWRSAWWHRDNKGLPQDLMLTLPEAGIISIVTVKCDAALGHGMIKEYELRCDNQTVASGVHDGSSELAIAFEQREATRITLRILSEQNGLPWASVSEMSINAAGSPFSIANISEEEANRREDQRLRGRTPPRDDSPIELVDLSLRTYDLLDRDGVDVAPFTETLTAMVADATCRDGDPSFCAEIKAFRRRMIFSHSGLDFAQLLINKHPTTGYHHQCDQYLGRHSNEGIGMCVVEDWKSTPVCTPLFDVDAAIEGGAGIRGRTTSSGRIGVNNLDGKLPRGEVRHPDLSYDGEKLVFGFCDHEATEGEARAFFLYECDTDGSNVRQLTGTEDDPLTGWENRATVLPEDFDPCYLPDGGIAFISTRSQTFGRCHGSRYTPTYLAYRYDDDLGIRQLSFGEANEWDPSVLPNGRVVFTRWDYINRHDVRFQSLWTMMPDGTGVAHYYGNYSPSPCMQAECRTIPGTNKTVFTATAHHAYTAGSICICDPLKGEDGWAPITRVTPEAACPECSDPYWSRGPQGDVSYCAPWPVTEEIYFAARLPYKHMSQGNHGPGDFDWAIYLVDSLGGRELIYEDPDSPCYAPIPLRPRETPAAIPSRLDVASEDPTGVFYVSNVYDCRQPIEPGTAKYMRINQIYGQPTRSKPWLSTANNEIIKSVVGYVPINADGSVAFRAPAGVPLQLQVCDENSLAVMTMRSFVFLHQGEMASCTGCHEPRDSTPAPIMSGGRFEIHDPTPTPGPTYPGGFSFQRTVQPVLDRYCIGCHGLEDELPGDMNLLGTPDGQAFTSYNSLTTDRELVLVAYRNQETAYSTPMEYYGHAGRLAAHLMSDRHRKNVELDPESWQRIADWLDLNAQCYGDYSHNRIEKRGIDGNGERALREAIAERFGTELSEQPIATLINVGQPSESRILNAPLASSAGGWGQMSDGWNSTNDAEYLQFATMVEDCIRPQDHYDVRGTCGKSDRCSCGCCFARRLDEQRLYPVIDRQFAGDDGNARPPEGSIELDKSAWSVAFVDSQETNVADLSAENAFDGNDRTFWCTEFNSLDSDATPQGGADNNTRTSINGGVGINKDQTLPPHELVIDLGESFDLCAIRCLQRDGLGAIRECEIYVSDDQNDFGEPVEQVRFGGKNDARTVIFTESKQGRYLKIRTLSEWNDGLSAAIREIWAYAKEPAIEMTNVAQR